MSGMVGMMQKVFLVFVGSSSLHLGPIGFSSLHNVLLENVMIQKALLNEACS